MSVTLPVVMQQALVALRPVLNEAVFIGGWAHRLHADHPLAKAKFEPLTTVDCDIALPLQLASSNHDSLDHRLQEAGFECRVAGNPMVESRRYVSVSDPEFYIQFVTCRQGDATHQPRAENLVGVLAEPLRDIDIALSSPWTVELEIGSGQALAVRVVNPVAFLIGKLLVAGEHRRGDNRAKDLVYVADTLLMFEDAIDELNERAGHVLAGLSRSQARRLRGSLNYHFSEVGSDSLHAAAQISAQAGGGRKTDVSGLRSLICYGVRFIFGDEWLPGS